MSESFQPPPDVERRAYQMNSTLSPELPPERGGSKLTDPVAVSATRKHVTILLDRQFMLARGAAMPASLMLIELVPAEEVPLSLLDAALLAVGKICRSHLRPNDVIFKYRGVTLGLVLHACDQEGGSSVCTRLRQAVSQRLFFGKKPIVVVPVFGVTTQPVSHTVSGTALLARAESSIAGARAALDFTF